MFSLEFLIYVLIAMGFLAFFSYFWKLERKYDLWCFVVAYFIFWGFVWVIDISILMDKFELAPQIISSLVIAELTLALVWVELSKRPELKLLGFVPITHIVGVLQIWKAGENVGRLSNPSRVLGIREAIDVPISIHSSFSVDVANVGYEEIMAHEYVVFIDGKRESPKALLSESNPQERLILRTQQRHTINIEPLHIRSPGFHKIRMEVYATTVKCSKEIWFFISEDSKKLRYVEMYPIKRLLSPLIKNKLKTWHA